MREKKQLIPKEWMEEFKQFVSIEPVQPPKFASDRILARVHSDLNPAAWKIFGKVSIIHAVVGGVTLLFCPQFGVSVFGGMGLMALFMRFGEFACMMGCGAVFLGASTLVAATVLRPEEIRVFRRSELIQVSGLAAISMAALICFGADVVFPLGLAWILGSVLGGLLTLELGWALRTWFRKKRVHAF